jgi:hypothetical protein
VTWKQAAGDAVILLQANGTVQNVFFQKDDD